MKIPKVPVHFHHLSSKMHKKVQSASEFIKITGTFKTQTRYKIFALTLKNSEIEMKIPYLPYIFGRIKIIIFFTVRTFNLEKNINFLVSKYL